MAIKNKIRAVYGVLLLVAGSSMIMQSCTIDNFNDGIVPLDENEFRLAGQIIGESVSESDNGLLSSFPEAFAIPDQNGLQQGSTFLSLRPIENLLSYNYSYNPVSGNHIVQFTRAESFNNEVFNTEVSLTYQFRDKVGILIEDPYQNRTSIESVDFIAVKTGSIENADKSSVFNRNDRFFIDGLSGNSPRLLIDGIHSGEGLFTRIQPDGTRLEREYILDMNFLNVAINKEVVESNRNFRSGVNGALSYESTIRENSPSDNGTKIVNGTLEFTGDGTALLKFRDFLNVYRVRLESGAVFDDDEFEGRVTDVDLPQNIFVLANGQRIRIDSQTEIDDDGDYFTLQDVSDALMNGKRVKAEGDYIRNEQNANLWTAIDVEFEDESNEFEEPVISVDLGNNTFTVQSGDIFYITGSSEIDDDGVFFTLTEVQQALAGGIPVKAEGKFEIESVTGNFKIKEVEFSYNIVEIEEIVTSVNLTEQTFTVESGKQVRITEETMIDQDKYSSLEEVSAALDQGIQIEADADIYFNDSSGLWIAIEVEFEDADDEGEED